MRLSACNAVLVYHSSINPARLLPFVTDVSFRRYCQTYQRPTPRTYRIHTQGSARSYEEARLEIPSCLVAWSLVAWTLREIVQAEIHSTPMRSTQLISDCNN